MQALFYIGLFGTFFFVMSGITVGVARNTMQQQLDREDRIVKIFDDIEYSINRVLLRDQLSLAGEPAQNMNYVLPNLSWSSDDITTDPWARPIVAARIDEDQVIAAFGGGDQAVATVSHFALISGGPDRVVDTPIPQTVTEWRNLHSTGAVGDDIVHTFSTREPMTETWNEAAQVEKNVQEIAVRNYRQRIEQFSPSSGSADDNVVGIFTSCALLNQTDNINGLNCTPFNSTLIRECNQMYNYNQQMDAYEASAGSQEPGAAPAQRPTRPKTSIIPYNEDVQVGQCWRYDTTLKANIRFPTMAGDPEGGQRNCQNQSDCTVQPTKIGASSEVARDPFGGFRMVYDDNNPDEITFERDYNVQNSGWRIVRNNQIRAD